MNIGCQSMVGPLQRVLVQHARDALGSQARIEDQWEALGFQRSLDLSRALADYEIFLGHLEARVAEVVFQPRSPATTLDGLYAHDSAVVTDRGLVLSNMGKAARQPEVAAVEALARDQGWPVLGRIEGEGRLEGGDVCWLDRRTVAVGLTYRTNLAGLRQLEALLGDGVDRVIPVPMPHWNGPGECLHLLSAISPVAEDLALVDLRMLPVPFVELLGARGVGLIEVAPPEADTLACNVLALEPGRVIALEENRETNRRLEAAGVEVLTYPGREISIPGTGGPTCLTRPLLRG
jgi:N-dimethylarginine dimethylaminohydrolase